MESTIYFSIFFKITGYDQNYLSHFLVTACKVTVELSWALGIVTYPCKHPTTQSALFTVQFPL